MAKNHHVNRRGTVKVVGKMIRDGKEVWRVSADGQIKNLVTRRSSTSAMDDAMTVYGRALQRLANR